MRAPLATGVRAIEALLTLGRGQRVGIMAGTGVSKSVLLGQIARWAAADVVVVALIGERGREITDFIETELAGPARAHHYARSAGGRRPAVAHTRGLIRMRRDRDRFFPAKIIADPAWDMLLDLAAARLEGQRVSVSSLCTA